MASRGAHSRLTREYKNFLESPSPYIEALPDESNILEWHYVITGPPETPYEGGQYHGTLTFPADYPFKPPAIRMLTPSGRFQPGMRLCLSISDYHPQTWNPAWSVSTILTGLLSFMVSDETTAGSIGMTDEARIEFARQSKANNLRSKAFVDHFPELCESNKADIKEAAQKEKIEREAVVFSQPPTIITVPQVSRQGTEPVRPVAGAKVAVADPVVDKPEVAGKTGMSRAGKIACFTFLFVSWLVASKVFTSHL